MTQALADAAARRAAERSAVYRAFAVSLRFPSTDLHARARAGRLESELRALLGDEAAGSGLGDVDPDYERFQSTYIALFSVGPGGPPCPLVGGAWGSDRQTTMEDALRFYRFFGLTIAAGGDELPDAASAELEFLHFLAFREAEALAAAEDAGPFRRARRDFLLRHPAKWLPKAAERLREVDAPRFWRSLVDIVAATCVRDADALGCTLGRPPSEPRNTP